VESYQSDICRFRTVTLSPLHLIVNWPVFTILLCPYLAPFQRYSDILVENRHFNPRHLYLALPLGVTPLDFRRDFWLQTTRVPVLSYDVACVILGLAILVKRPTSDIQTDGHTMTAYVALA